jgi:hypothetical protein
MRMKNLCAALVFILLGSFGILAQETKRPLTNSDVIELTKAGLPENTIILAIQKGPTQFDTSAQTLIQLKNQGVNPQVLNAMIQAGSTSVSSNPPSGPPPKPNVNPFGLPANEAAAATGSGGVILVDSEKRREMKYSTPEARTNSMLGAVVNPFHKSRGRAALKGNHASLRISNTSPFFEMSLEKDANPSDLVTLVRLKPKSETREIETFRGSITGVSSGFRKEDLLPITIEDTTISTGPSYKLYRIKLVNPLVPGEYALVYRGSAYYDFGVDSTK